LTEIVITPIEVDGENSSYQLEVSQVQWEAIRSDMEKTAHEICFVFLATLEANGQSGAHNAERPVLRLSGVVPSEEDEIVLYDLMTQLSTAWVNHHADSPYYPKFSAGMSRDFSAAAPKVTPPIEDHIKYLEVAPEIWGTIDSIAKDSLGEALYGDDLVNFAIQSAIDEANPTDDLLGTVIAVGVWLGNEIIKELGFRWVSLEDSYGTSLCVYGETSEAACRFAAPLNAVQKRLDRREAFDARTLVTDLCQNLSA